MIVSIATCRNDQRISASADIVGGVSPADFSTKSVRERRRACRVLAARTRRKHSLYVSPVIQPAISLTAPSLLLNLNESVHDCHASTTCAGFSSISAPL